MANTVLIDDWGLGTRVALLSDGEAVCFYSRSGGDEGLLGNLCKGKVENVLPALEAAFVNIGQEKKAFLQAKDIPQNGEKKPINKLVRPGEEILVQVIKEPYAAKGAGVTADVKLSGESMVLFPFSEHLSISRKITDSAERERLKEIFRELCPSGMGVIVRTRAAECTCEELQEEMGALLTRWERIRETYRRCTAPCIVEESDGFFGFVIGQLRPGDRVIVNTQRACEEVQRCIARMGVTAKAELVSDPLLFDTYGIEERLAASEMRRVILPGGGEIVFDTTEAMTVIDVNSASAKREATKEETVLSLNLRAAREIAAQLRLRNIGGIVIVDFVDMEREEDRRQLLDCLKEETASDPVQTCVHGMTSLGLVELTRKRTVEAGESLSGCHACHGTGRQVSWEETLRKVRRDVLRALNNTDMPCILVEGGAALIRAMGEQTGLREELLRFADGRTLWLREGTKGREYRVRTLIRQEISAMNDARLW